MNFNGSYIERTPIEKSLQPQKEFQVGKKNICHKLSNEP